MDINTLYREARAGDKTSEEELFRSLTVRFRLFVSRKILNKEDAEEIVQETMVTVIEGYRKIDFEISFSAWAYNVLINRIRNYHGKKLKGMSRSDINRDMIDGQPDWEPDPVLVPKLLSCLKKIAGVNRNYARILNLKFQGYSVEEICRKLGITSNNLYVILHRARSLLKSCLEKEGIL